MSKANHDADNQRISQDYEALSKRASYEVVVVGSGYGGGIAASRLARAGQAVCLLERGLEIRPGDYPSNLSDIGAHSQIRTDTDACTINGKTTALFDLRINEDVSVLVGCGLGGTSLINANVSLELNEAVFERDGLEWPREFRQQPSLLKDYYQLARESLGANPYPASYDTQTPGYKPLNKLRALEKSGLALGVEVQRPDINVTFNQNKNNHFGFSQAQCNLCGDCCSGCNVGAKNTTLMNYLPDAHQHGAELFCNTSVDYIEQTSDGWQVHVTATDSSARGRKKHKIIKAKILILAAGTLGTSEIMLRSKAQGLVCSDKLGQHFSGNGDLLAFGYNSYWKDNNEDTDPILREDNAPRYESVYGVGKGDNELSDEQMPGPCITGVIDLRDGKRPLEDQLVIQEGVAPGAFASVLLGGLVFGAASNANFLRYGATQAETRLRDIESLATAVQNDPNALNQLSYSGPISRTQNYLVMSMDKSQGELKLDHGSVIVDWPNAGKCDALKNHHTTLARVNDAVQGQLIKNPLWGDAFGNKLITVHPLGGCRMADQHSNGVVNHKGQVFNCESNNSVYDDLYICDGSVIPGAIGVNPLLTISALAERCCALLAQERGWSIDYQVGGRSSNPTASRMLSDQPSGLVAPELNQSAVTEDELDAVSSADDKTLWQNIKSSSNAVIKRHDKPFRASFEFTETMIGFVGQTNNNHTQTTLSKRDYQRAYAEGRSQANRLQLTMTIHVPEMRELSQDRHYVCQINQGQVTIAEQSMSIKSGSFRLLIPDENNVESWLMLYQLEFNDQHNRPVRLCGRKTFHCTEESHWWTDLTSLEIDIFSLEKAEKNDSPKRVYSGVAELKLQDLIKMANSFETKLGNGVLKRILGKPLYALVKASDATDTIKDSVSMVYLAKLAISLGETAFYAYGGLLSTLNNFPQKELENYTSRPHIKPKHFPLITTEDGSTIRLTRYQAERKSERQDTLSPVILANGMGVTASSFATDTVKYNLVEYLTNHGREVWLFDYRASADSGASTQSFTVDDIAKYDWPAAINFVNQHSKTDQVQIVAHCVGSMSLMMSLLKGFVDKQQIKSIVSSQLALHPVSNWLNNAKSDLDIGSQLKSSPIIRQLGNTLDMRAGTTGFDRMFDVMAHQIPTPKGEQCNNPSCHRILAIYGPSYLHAQLNHATHLKIADWFGPINLNSFDQMSYMIKAGHVLDAEGKNSYLEGISRANENASRNNIVQLDLPITFMAGALNQEFLPQSSSRTYHWLRAHNPLSADSYHRHVFENYGHMDCFVGKNASVDIFPKIQQWLDQYQ